MFKYGVYSYGGAIGNSGTTLVKSFTKKEDAKKCAKGYNAVLTPGEKKYYGMKYGVRIYRLED
jgi:predicted DNA-binding WGR domain protein